MSTPPHPQAIARACDVLERGRTVSKAQALALIRDRTRPGGVPPQDHLASHADGNGALVLIDLPLDWIAANEAGERYDGTVRDELMRRYALLASDTVPPVLATVAREGSVRIVDGGHRLSAARLRADSACIPALVSIRQSLLDAIRHHPRMHELAMFEEQSRTAERPRQSC